MVRVPTLDLNISLHRCRPRDEDAETVIAEAKGATIGFVTVDPRTLYLDQIVVAPEQWGAGVGAALIEAATCLSPAGLDLDVNFDNARAIGFCGKSRFVISGAGVNPISGRPVRRMSWRPARIVSRMNASMSAIFDFKSFKQTISLPFAFSIRRAHRGGLHALAYLRSFR